MEKNLSDTILQNYKTIRNADPDDLSKAIISHYMNSIPSSIRSEEDLEKMGDLLGRLVNERTYLTGLLMQLRTEARRMKKAKDPGAEDMAMRRDIVDYALDSVKSQYDAVSRMLTVHKMQVEELRSLGEWPRTDRNYRG